MKKFNRREKLYIRLALAAIALALVMQGGEMYFNAKEALVSENDSLRDRNTAFQKKLEGESVEKYAAQAEELADELEGATDQVLELQKEADANLFLSQIISNRAEAAGLNINSISNRRSKVVSEGKELSELRTYFGYDSDLRSLLKFFELMDEEDFYVSIENLNISARRQPKRKSRRKVKIERKPLNGNAILTTLFHLNPEVTLDRFESILAASKSEPEDVEETGEGDPEEDDDTPEKKPTKSPAKKSGASANDDEGDEGGKDGADKPGDGPQTLTLPQPEPKVERVPVAKPETRGGPPTKKGAPRGLTRVPDEDTGDEDEDNGAPSIDSSEDSDRKGPRTWPNKPLSSNPKPDLAPKPRPLSGNNKTAGHGGN